MTLRTRARVLLAIVVGANVAVPPASAWLTEGHRRVTVSAVELLPETVPAFFREGAAAVGQVAIDPDLWKSADAPHLADSEGPEHYLDVELLGGRPLPAKRSDYLRLLGELGIAPNEAGLLPWALVEGVERLTLCFAEQRRWSDDEGIRAKCRVYAGWLAHYAGDLVQPLHTTIHHDGWALPDGRPSYSGIHRKIDALFESSPFDPAAAVAGIEPAPFADLPAAVVAEFERSHRLVDRTYGLEAVLAGPNGIAAPEVVAFACERYGVVARFLSSLYLTAWERSATVELPRWLAR